MIPGGLDAQAPRYRGTPRREELTRVPYRTAHTAHQLIQRTYASSSADLQILREPRGRNSSNKRSAQLPARNDRTEKRTECLNERHITLDRLDRDIGLLISVDLGRTGKRSACTGFVK